MKRNLLKLMLVLLVLSSLFAFAGDKKKKKKEDLASTMTFTVVKETNGKPVKYAAVILHPVNDDGKQGGGGLELKTNEDGKTQAPGIPYGKVRVQVIARGFQTYGEDLEVAQPNVAMTIKLKPPAEQFSIYK